MGDPVGSHKTYSSRRENTRTFACLAISVLLALNVFTLRSVWGQLPLTIEEQSRQSFNQTPNQGKDAQQEKYNYHSCTDGPKTLRQIDDLEREGKNANMEWLNRLRTPEDLAETLIADCSDKIAPLSLAAGLLNDESLNGLIRIYQNRLDFMKWWLQNRRQKSLEKRR